MIHETGKMKQKELIIDAYEAILTKNREKERAILNIER